MAALNEAAATAEHEFGPGREQRLERLQARLDPVREQLVYAANARTNHGVKLDAPLYRSPSE